MKGSRFSQLPPSVLSLGSFYRYILFRRPQPFQHIDLEFLPLHAGNEWLNVQISLALRSFSRLGYLHDNGTFPCLFFFSKRFAFNDSILFLSIAGK